LFTALFFLFTQNNEKDDIYLTVLLYGKENIGKPIKYSQLLQYLDDQGYEYDEFSIRQFFTGAFIANTNNYGKDFRNKPSEKNDYYLEQNGYFHLLDYFKLKEARDSSRTAMICAIIAILISAISILINMRSENKPHLEQSKQQTT